MPETPSELERVIDGWHHDPHSVLGAHSTETSTTFTMLRPWANSVSLVIGDEVIPMVHQLRGAWAITIDQPELTEYTLQVDYGQGAVDTDDPYRFLPTIGELDLHLISAGRHEDLWKVMGAHCKNVQGVDGVAFTVWAPSAQGVRVVGDFNMWDGAGYPMRSMGNSGVWELFVPGIGTGTKYKFNILTQAGNWLTKADPMAFYSEVPPANASVVFESEYQWNDAQWLEQRAALVPHKAPMSVYEVHLGSWQLGKSYRDLAVDLVSYVKDRGFTHVEFMPVAEHPYAPSWGYQVTGYYATTSRFGTPDDFRYLVDAFHQADIGVIVDWVPAHFPKDEWALGRFDGTALYEHADPQLGEHPDWGTYIFDFGRNEVRNFLVANAVFLLKEFHIDGLRVDAVASMLYLDYSREDGQWSPNRFGGRENLEAVEFLKEMNATAYRAMPGIVTIAEESTAWSGVTTPTDGGGLGFGLKWNMGWMHDSLEYVKHEPVHRQYHHNEMSFSLVYAWSENYVLPLSHDEVVHGKGSIYQRMPGDDWQRLANLRAYYGFMWAHPGKQLLFMGCEFGQVGEWSQENGLEWHLLDHDRHVGVSKSIERMNKVYRERPALWERDDDPAGFQWLISDDSEGNVFAWVRWDHAGNPLISITNFAPVARNNYRLPLPIAGTWDEVFNSDDLAFGGSDVGNKLTIDGHGPAHFGQPASADITLPPLATVWLALR
ncbi:MAG: 1,4-alpha-glucan branching protein GlgB [Actinobacteria bacterium]|nr:1,4-alpha-glucan branching protein GlgB [Actinomycetota bacterium]